MVWGEEEDGRRTASNILISGAKLNTSRRASGSVRQCLIRRALCNAKRSLFSQWLMNCLITRTVPPPTNQHRLPPPNPPTNYHHCTPLQPQSSDVTRTHIHTYNTLFFFFLCLILLTQPSTIGINSLRATTGDVHCWNQQYQTWNGEWRNSALDFVSRSFSDGLSCFICSLKLSYTH